MSEPSQRDSVPAMPPHRPKVFGIGWAKTGTTSLGECFRLLGLDHQGQDLTLAAEVMRGRVDGAIARAQQRGSFEDWPWILLFRQLDEAFPGSRFILTIRDPAGWLGSYRSMLEAQGAARPELRELRRFLYGFDVESAPDSALIDRFRRHNEEVIAHFRGRPC